MSTAHALEKCENLAKKILQKNKSSSWKQSVAIISDYTGENEHVIFTANFDNYIGLFSTKNNLFYIRIGEKIVEQHIIADKKVNEEEE